MRVLIACLMLLMALPSVAQIYKYKDANGNTAYSSQPPDGRPSETVELAPLNSVESQPHSPAQALPATTPPAPQFNVPVYRYTVLELTNIPDQAAIRANNGSFTVTVNIQPKLRAEHRLQLLLDGRPYGEPTNVPLLQLVNVDRGEHSLAVQVLSQTGALQQSETLTVTVQRVHLP